MKSGWETKKLGDCIKLQYGKPLPIENRDPNGKYAAYGANGIKERTDHYYHDKPSIVVGRKGSAGEVTLVEEPFWPLDVTYFVEFDETKFDLKYLYNLLCKLNLPRLAKGVKPGINRNDVYAIEVSYPELKEQQRIVAILDEAFAGIATATANAEKNLQNARELFESTLQSVFAEKGEGWGETNLGSLADFKNGLNFSKRSRGETIKIVGVKDFQSNYWVPMDELADVQIDGELPDAYLLHKGDILTVRSNGNKNLIGRCILAGDVPEITSHSGFTIRIRVKSEDVAPDFLVHYLKSETVRQLLIDSGGGANISSLNQTALTNLPVLLPSREEQASIVSRIVKLEQEKDKLMMVYQSKLDAFYELKQSLLQKAFAGELH